MYNLPQKEDILTKYWCHKTAMKCILMKNQIPNREITMCYGKVIYQVTTIKNGNFNENSYSKVGESHPDHYP